MHVAVRNLCRDSRFRLLVVRLVIWPEILRGRFVQRSHIGEDLES